MLFRPVHKRLFQAMSVAAIGPGLSGEIPLSAEAAKALMEGKRPEELAASEGRAVPGLPAAESAGEDIVSLESATDEQIERELMKEATAVDMGGRKYVVMKKRLVEKAKKDPEMVSQLIRTLLREKA